MYFFTHLFISKTLYKYFIGELPLDKNSFAYGNVKPDISRESRHISHTLENYLHIVNEKALQLIEKETSPEEFSVSLGEICHYVCDFFCLYHLNEEIYHKKFHHFLYELRLHLELYKIYFSRKLKMQKHRIIPHKNIDTIILEMRKEYLLKPHSYKLDIDYAFHTAIQACEAILFYLDSPPILMKEHELEHEALFQLRR